MHYHRLDQMGSESVSLRGCVRLPPLPPLERLFRHRIFLLASPQTEPLYIKNVFVPTLCLLMNVLAWRNRPLRPSAWLCVCAACVKAFARIFCFVYRYQRRNNGDEGTVVCYVPPNRASGGMHAHETRSKWRNVPRSM